MGTDMAESESMETHPSGDHGAVQRAHALFSFFDRSGIPWAVVGDSSDLDHAIRSDVDIVIDPGSLGRVPGLMDEFARSCGARLIQALRHEAVACYYVLAWRSDDGIGFLHPDICGDWWRGGRPFIDAGTMLDQRIRDDAGFMRPSPGRNAVYYLLKRLSKGALDPARCAFIAREWNAEPDIAHSLATRCVPERADALHQACLTGDWSAILADLPAWSRAIDGGFAPGLSERSGDLTRRIGRVLHPTGLLVDVGGGFTADAGTAFLARWSRAFRRTRVAPAGGATAALRMWPTLARSTLILRPTTMVAQSRRSWNGTRLAVHAGAWSDGSVDQLMLETLAWRVHALLGIASAPSAVIAGLGVG